MNTNIIEKAIIKAINLHQGQNRKGDENKPYIVHPLEVGIMLSRFTSCEDLIAAGILHDTIEDCVYSSEELEKEFGPIIKELVLCLTEDKEIKNWSDRKNENISRLRSNQDAYFIKSIDALNNMKSLISALKEEGGMVWKRFNASKEEKLNYFRVILKDVVDFIPKRLLEEYVGALKDLEYSECLELRNDLGFTLNS